MSLAKLQGKQEEFTQSLTVDKIECNETFSERFHTIPAINRTHPFFGAYANHQLWLLIL